MLDRLLPDSWFLAGRSGRIDYSMGIVVFPTNNVAGNSSVPMTGTNLVVDREWTAG